MPVLPFGGGSPGPAGAHLTYNGGPVISNVDVVVVFWGNNVSTTVTNGIYKFFQEITVSPYQSLLSEYSTTNASYNGTSTKQTIGYGSVRGPYTIAPSVTSSPVDDSAIQAELAAQIASKALPAPTKDSLGYSNSLYMVYFPPGTVITQGGSSSCAAGGFCAYHGTAYTKDGLTVFQYGVMPDMGPGSGCDTGCGNSSFFGNVTSVTSHEYAESITDAQVGLAGNGNGPPLAWYDNSNGEIGDICNAHEQTVTWPDGYTAVVQQIWSNAQNLCVTSPAGKISPVISWTTPAPITYGTALGSSQLNASANVPGTFVYSPAAGAILSAGQQALKTTFTPNDTNTYSTATASVTLQVNKATPTVTWATPAPITYGTALSSTQLNATASVNGTFAYTPASGTVLSAGMQTLKVTFTPADSMNYNPVNASVTLQVSQIAPNITWPTPAPVTYGTALGSAQLNATASVPGTFAYAPAAGAVLTAGQQTLKVTFTPSDSNYSTATASVILQVNQATPAITWATPAPISYGIQLGAAQLNATSPVAGAFVYTPAAGAVLTVGQQTLSVKFTPTDTTDYTTATASVTLQVNQATPTITWATPAPISYGTQLGAAQLNATSPVAGAFVYSPAAGALLTVGQQTLNVKFTPTDTGNYTTATASVTLQVNQATPTITWSNPVAITYGTALGASQLNALSSVPGSFVYSPAAGTVLPAGMQTLKVTFNPNDSTNYAAATASVTLQVNQATPTVTWSNPAPITPGTPLSGTQLNATASVPGTFVYTPGAWTVLSPGMQTLKVNFTPADTTDYTTASASVTLQVNQITPQITWAAPAAITYGVQLSASQLNASASVAGTFLYSPAIGAVLPAGNQVLSVTFTPSDTVTYTKAAAIVPLLVNKATITVAANNVSRTYGMMNPPLTAGYGGFVNGEGSSVLTGSPALMTAASASSLPGNYPITVTQGTLGAVNYNFVFVNGTLTVNPTGVAPLSGEACNGAYTGTFQGDLHVSGGQTCIFLTGGGFSGDLESDGGNVILIGASAGGNVQATGAGSITVKGGAIGGNLEVQNLSAKGSQSTVCAVTVEGNLEFQNNAAAVAIGLGTTACPGNTIRSNLLIQNNAGTTQVFDNTIDRNLNCAANSAITGGGNKAKGKHGQCASF